MLHRRASTLLAIRQRLAPTQTAPGWRHASTQAAGPNVLHRLRSAVVSTAVVLSVGAFYLYTQDASAGVHRWVFLPVIQAYTRDDPERAHEIAVALTGSGLAPKDRGVDSDRLAIELWGKRHANPLGMAAGFDKHGEAIDGLFDLGFGYVEVGSITPEPQPGNPKPRVFKIPEANALVNRYGFNSHGHLSAIGRLRARVHAFISAHALELPASIFPPPPETALPDHDVVAQLLASPEGKEAAVVDGLGLHRSLKPGKVLAINLGKNKTSAADSIDDFTAGVAALGPYADILVVNVSSPNTPGLRNLQRKGVLEELLSGVVAARNALSCIVKPPVLVKVAPDLDAEQLEDIAAAVLGSGIDGIIVSNTTISRPSTAGTSSALLEAGGLSGPPLKPLALAALSALYNATEGKVPLIGCGGISTGADAVEFAKAGASLVQLYTSFIYGGVGLPRQIKDEITAILDEEQANWVDIIGSGAVRVSKPVAAPTPVEHAVIEDEHLLAGMEELVGTPVIHQEEDALSPIMIEAHSELEALLVELAAGTPAESAPVVPSPSPAAIVEPLAEVPLPLVTDITTLPEVPVAVLEAVAAEEKPKEEVVDPIKAYGKRWV